MSGWARALSLAAVLVVMGASSPGDGEPACGGDAGVAFAEFKQKHGRVYGSAAEEAFRLSVFRANLFLARLHAAANPHATFGVTPFSDLTREEFRVPLPQTARRHFAGGAGARESAGGRGGCWRAPRQRIGARRRRDSRQEPGNVRLVLGLCRHWQH
ncbi:putative cysteine peptidase [Trypanosoma cruzi]|nr:putative cysteine peptidase [Trypanosoma cruzi]